MTKKCKNATTKHPVVLSPDPSFVQWEEYGYTRVKTKRSGYNIPYQSNILEILLSLVFVTVSNCVV